MANSLSTGARIRFLAEPSGQDSRPTDPALVLFSALEISLFRSQKALLARDLSGILRGTAEQTILWREISTAIYSTKIYTAAARPDALTAASHADFPAQLSPWALRILHLARVHAALLVKAQRSLQMIASLAGALGTSYAPPPWQGDTARGSSHPA
jgi:hypothetical protein